MIPHAAIPSTDLDRSIAFYSRLGFQEGKRWERPDWNMQGLFLIHSSGLNLELIVHPGNATIQRHAIPEVQHIGIPVTDIQATFSNLELMHTTIIKPIMPGITVNALAFIQDPDGNTIELFEPKS